MTHIMFPRNPTGSTTLGLFVLGIGAFVWSVIDPLFGPYATVSIGGGVVVAGLLLRRRPQGVHLDLRK